MRKIAEHLAYITQTTTIGKGIFRKALLSQLLTILNQMNDKRFNPTHMKGHFTYFNFWAVFIWKNWDNTYLERKVHRVVACCFSFMDRL